MVNLHIYVVLLTTCCAMDATDTLSVEEELLNLIGDGIVGPARVSRVARAISRVADSTTIQRIGSWGNSGSHNSERNLHRWAKSQPWRSILPNTYDFETFIRKRRGIGVKRILLSGLLPHEVFSNLYQSAREMFHYIFTGPPGNLKKFWQESATISSEWYRNHPIVRQVTDVDMLVPIGLHGDDTGGSGHEKALIISWNSVAVSHTTLDNRILFAAVGLMRAVPRQTLWSVYAVLAWSLYWLSRGQHPDRDHKGIQVGDFGKFVSTDKSAARFEIVLSIF